MNDKQPSTALLKALKEIQGLLEKLAPLKLPKGAEAELTVSAAEFLLEGMTAHKRISRSEARTFTQAKSASASKTLPASASACANASARTRSTAHAAASIN